MVKRVLLFSGVASVFESSENVDSVLVNEIREEDWLFRLGFYEFLKGEFKGGAFFGLSLRRLRGIDGEDVVNDGVENVSGEFEFVLGGDRVVFLDFVDDIAEEVV